MKAYDIVKAHGHPNIKATHRTTIEITREKHLTPRGDCIIGVSADKSAADLNSSLRTLLRRDDVLVVIILKTNNHSDVVLAMGSSNLIVNDPTRIIIRRSTYVEPATIAVRSNKSAADINRELVADLKDPGTELFVEIIALTLDEVEPVDIGVGSIV